MVLGSFLEAPGAPKLVSGGSRGGPGERAPRPEGSRGRPETENERFEMMVDAAEVLETYIFIDVSAIFKKTTFFLDLAHVIATGGPRRLPKRVGSALENSQRALGNVDQVLGGPFWDPLDRKKFAEASILMENVGSF